MQNILNTSKLHVLDFVLQADRMKTNCMHRIRIYVYRHMDIFPSPEMFNKSFGLFKH